MSWKTVHENLSRLARAKGQIDAEEATWLAEAKRERVHTYLGFGSLTEYLGRVFGYSPRLASEKVRVAETLEELPGMREKLAAAELPWSAVRELTRVASPKTEASWIRESLGKTVREVERLVSGKKPGDTPDTPAEPGAMRVTLRLDLSADTMAAFREAREQCTREVGHALEEDELVRMILEKALAAGGRDESLSPYQVKLSVCTECGRGERAAAGELHPVSPVRVEQAMCDAQILGADSRDPRRATQKVPPRIRRDVLRRDNACIVPGCRNTAFREVHHVIWRSHGGTHDPETLCDLCSAHHQAVHAGAIRIEGTHAEGFRVYHADGRSYGASPLAPAPTWADPPADPAPTSNTPTARAALEADALAALRQSGFKDREARRALAETTGETLEELLRQALAFLGRRLYPSRPRGGPSRASEAALFWCAPRLNHAEFALARM